jgi:hypothetical protein
VLYWPHIMRVPVFAGWKSAGFCWLEEFLSHSPTSIVQLQELFVSGCCTYLGSLGINQTNTNYNVDCYFHYFDGNFQG